MAVEPWALALVVAAAAHVGLELVVQLVVYPALAAGSTAAPAVARAAHEAHTRRMALAVAPVYLALVVSAVGYAVAAATAYGVLPVGLVVAVLAVTALLAVPCHEAIVRSPSVTERAALHRRLARVDRLRLVLAVVLLAVAVPAAA